MPRLNDNLEEHKPQIGAYGFSGTRIDALGATEYTLVTIAQDVSSSVQNFKSEMEKCIQEIVKACKFSPRADNLMIRLTEFASDLNEIHGFKQLESCNLADYKDVLNVGGMTALFDASENAATSTARYGKQLMEKDFDVNGILFVITDGRNNHSTLNINAVKESFKEALKSESLESMVSILVGVDVSDPDVSSALTKFKEDAGFTQYLEIDNADSKTLAKLAEFVSKSISSQSQSLGTGGPSTQLPTSLSI